MKPFRISGHGKPEQLEDGILNLPRSDHLDLVFLINKQDQYDRFAAGDLKKRDFRCKRKYLKINVMISVAPDMRLVSYFILTRDPVLCSV